jgi:hypothetical protein
VSAVAYQAGLDTFYAEFAQLEAEGKELNRPFRAGGKATKMFPNKEDRTWWMAEGPKMVHAYYTWRQQHPELQIWHTPEGAPGIELQCTIELEDGTLLKGLIDRVFQDKNTGELMIVDLKTGKPPSSPLQLAVYRLMLKQTFGVEPAYGSYWMGRSGTLDSVHDLRKYPTEMISRWMRDVNKAIKQDIFVPNIAMHCGWCGLRNNCYAWNTDVQKPDFLNDITIESKGN